MREAALAASVKARAEVRLLLRQSERRRGFCPSQNTAQKTKARREPGFYLFGVWLAYFASLAI
jgi:hypothetical protein